MKRIFAAAAGILMIAAFFFVWRSDFDKAFVLAALGIVAWFLSYRVELRALTTAADESEQKDQGEEIEE